MSEKGSSDQSIAKVRAHRLYEALEMDDMETARETFEKLKEFFDGDGDDA